MSITPSLIVHNKVVPNEVFHFGLMTLFMVKHAIISFNPYRPKGQASKEVPNVDLLSKLLRNSFPKEVFASDSNCHNPSKLTHDEGGPPPSMPCLNAIPKLVFNRLASIRKANNYIVCLEIEVGVICALHALTTIALCQMNHTNGVSLLGPAGSHTCDQ